MCECLKQEGGMWLCEACAAAWQEWQREQQKPLSDEEEKKLRKLLDDVFSLTIKAMDTP